MQGFGEGSLILTDEQLIIVNEFKCYLTVFVAKKLILGPVFG